MDRANIAANPGRGGAWSCATCGFAAKGCLGRAANVAAALSARSASYQAINPGKKNRSSNGDQDGVNRAALTRAAQQTHDPTTDDGAADTEQDVSDHAFATAHDLAGHPAGDQTHDNPPQHMHKFSSSGEQERDSCSRFGVRRASLRGGCLMWQNSELPAQGSPRRFSLGEMRTAASYLWVKPAKPAVPAGSG